MIGETNRMREEEKSTLKGADRKFWIFSAD